MAQQLDVRYVSFYSSGSSALKVTPVAPVKTLPLPKKRRAKKVLLLVDPVACAGILLAGVMAVMMTVGFVKLTAARNEEAAMASYVSSLEVENKELKEAFAENCDLEEVKKVALALGMVPVEEANHVSTGTN